MVWEQEQRRTATVTARNYVDGTAIHAFADINAWGGRNSEPRDRRSPENVTAGTATPGFLGMLGYGHPLALGRSFVEEKASPGATGRHPDVSAVAGALRRRPRES